MIKIRKAEAADVELLLEMIRKLATFEQAGNQVSNSAGRMRKEGFGENPAFFAFLAFYENKAIGFALGYYRYSTWKGKTLFLEDLFVEESFRHRGAGKALIDTLAAKAREEGLSFIDLQVLDWNEPAIAFYKKLGGTFDPDWINVRLPVETLA